MHISEIKTRVRAIIDELTQNESNFLTQSEDERNLTRIIVDKIPHALSYCVLHANPQLFQDSDGTWLSTGVTLTINSSDKVGKAVLPQTVLRVLRVRMSSWWKSVEPCPSTSPLALMQGDAYARGSYDRPVAVFVEDSAAPYLMLYSGRTTNDTVSIQAVTKITPTETELLDDSYDVNVPSALESAFLYHVAALTMATLQEGVSDRLFTISNNYLG